MRLQIENGASVGTAEWAAPGEVRLEMPDPAMREWLDRYFDTEEAFLGGPIGGEFMQVERPSDSEEAFRRAAFRLAALRYRVRQTDD